MAFPSHVLMIFGFRYSNVSFVLSMISWHCDRTYACISSGDIPDVETDNAGTAGVIGLAYTVGVFDCGAMAGVDLMTSGRFIKSLKKSFVSSS